MIDKSAKIYFSHPNVYTSHRYDTILGVAYYDIFTILPKLSVTRLQYVDGDVA